MLIKPFPELIQGGTAVDDRGAVSFCNGLDIAAAGIKRFYTVRNHRAGFVRAWHGHRREAKYVTVLQGAALIGSVLLDSDPDTPVVHRFVLSSAMLTTLYIPPGYANGWMSLTPDTILGVFSTATLEESKGDDERFPADHWGRNVWEIEER